MIRTTRCALKFGHAFTLKDVDGLLPPGNYELVTDEELIEGLSFPAYRRVASWLLVPMRNSIEMINVDPAGVTAAHARDALVNIPLPPHIE